MVLKKSTDERSQLTKQRTINNKDKSGKSDNKDKSKDVNSIKDVKSDHKDKDVKSVKNVKSDNKGKGKSLNIYFDTNANVPMYKPVIDVLSKWSNIGCNPSSTSAKAQKSQLLLEAAKKRLLDHCSISSKLYTVIFTSGASESNCTIITGAALAYKKKLKRKPKIVISSIEHESILSCVRDLEHHELAEIIYIEPNIEGVIKKSNIERIIDIPDIALISIMYANNELGTVNDIAEIGALAHQHNIPFHTDCVQAFSKIRIPMNKNNIDALSMSFHKLGGPIGIGALIIKNEFIEGYELCGIIKGKQQGGLRGGTIPIPNIAAAMKALDITFHHRDEKNTHLINMRNEFIERLSRLYPLGNYAEYVKRDLEHQIIDEEVTLNHKIVDDINKVEIVILGPTLNHIKRVLPNTILLSIAKNNLDRYGFFCNKKLKEYLDKHGIIVSIGSACNAHFDKRSHVLHAIKCPDVIARGTIRVSLPDNVNLKMIKDFMKVLEEGIKKQVS